MLNLCTKNHVIICKHFKKSPKKPVISVNLAKFKARNFGKNHQSGTKHKLVLLIIMVKILIKNHVNICKRLHGLEGNFSVILLSSRPVISVKIIGAEQKLNLTCSLSWWTYISKIMSISASV